MNSIIKNLFTLLKTASKVYAQGKFCQHYGMSLADFELYKQIGKNTSTYYSTKLSLTLKNKVLNKKLQKRVVLTPAPSASGIMKI